MLSELKSKNELIGDVICLAAISCQECYLCALSGKNTVAGLVKALEERGTK